MILAPALGNVASSRLMATERATPVDRRDLLVWWTGQGSLWMSPIRSVRFMSMVCSGKRNLQNTYMTLMHNIHVFYGYFHIKLAAKYIKIISLAKRDLHVRRKVWLPRHVKGHTARVILSLRYTAMQLQSAVMSTGNSTHPVYHPCPPHGPLVDCLQKYQCVNDHPLL